MKKINMFSLAFLGAVMVLSLLVSQMVCRADNLSEEYQKYVDSGRIPGFVSIIQDENGNIRTDCVGWQDLEKTRKMAPDTIAWIASTSKFITCAGIMMLVDEGKIELDAPLEKYLPEFKDIKVLVKNEDGTETLRAPETKPTVRQSLSHTAGFRFFVSMPIDAKTLQELVAEVAELPLLYEPGTRWQYSNLGIDMGAAVLERVSGQKYEDFLQERLFNPLGMKDTTFWLTEEQMTRIAKCYDVRDGKTVEIPIGQLTTPYTKKEGRYAEAGGGLFSTAQDVFRFTQMIANGGVFEGKQIMSRSAVEYLSKKQTGDKVPNWYGFGTGIGGDWFGHGGACGTDAQANLKTGACGVFFVQLGGHPDRDKTKRIWDEYLRK